MIFSKAHGGKKLFTQQRSGRGPLSALLVALAVAGCLALAFVRDDAGSAAEIAFGCVALASVALGLALLVHVRSGSSWRRR